MNAPNGLDRDDAAVVLLADLRLLDDGLDAAGGLFATEVARRDEDRAVFLDVDLRAGLVLDAADDLAAGADDVADLVGRDLDGDDARSVLAHLLARNLDRLHHLAEDEGAAFLGLQERGAQDVDGQALGLVVHLHGRDAVLGTGDLEVHVAEEVLEALDVGQDGDVVALLDEAHRDTGDRSLDRHAGVHERERRAADRAHRARAVGLEHLGHDADRVRERRPRRG